MHTVTIALDAMGGDYGPKPLVEGALQAVAQNAGLKVLLVGLGVKIEEALRDLNPGWRKYPVEIVETEGVDGMEESKFDLGRKAAGHKESSIQKCIQLVKVGKASAALSAGSTTAGVFWSLKMLNTYPLPDTRPAIPIHWPHSRGYTVLIDAGATVDADAPALAHFAMLGFYYAKFALGNADPTVGLLSIGEERTKGNSKIRQAYQLIQERLPGRFKGMVEGKDLPRGKVDVVVCDAFIGNIAIKLAEGLIEEFGNILRKNLSLPGKMGALLMLPDLKKIKKSLSWETYGAMPLLGVDGDFFIAHGKSTPKAICNGLLYAGEYAKKDVLRKIRAEYTGLPLSAKDAS